MRGEPTDLEDPAGVDIEGHLNLGVAPGPGRDAAELELAQQSVVLGQRALALEYLSAHGASRVSHRSGSLACPVQCVTDLDEDAGLVVGVRGEGLLLAGGDGRAALHQLRHDTANRLTGPSGTTGGTDLSASASLHLVVVGGAHLNPKGQRGHVDQHDVLGSVVSSAAQDGLCRRRAASVSDALLPMC